jgi:hypothetical protein
MVALFKDIQFTEIPDGMNGLLKCDW